MSPLELVDELEYVVLHSRSGSPPDERVRTALAAALDFLGDRAPYKTPLPRGYSLRWSAAPDATGQTQRHHQLLKPATAEGPGLWIDTANLDQLDPRDVRVFADDLSSGFLRELSQFLKSL